MPLICVIFKIVKTQLSDYESFIIAYDCLMFLVDFDQNICNGSI